jgi:aminoglycoside phosphotransferase (APT) family kinase protein
MSGDREPEAEPRPPIDAALVERLVAEQFPRWAGLPVKPVEFGGVDNRTFHLGDEMSVRLPSAAGYAGQAAKEHRWLPELGPRLPLAVPTVLARGVPAQGYPFDWSVLRWIDGETASPERIADLTGFATTLAGFLNRLHALDSVGGPAPGQHTCFRGAPLLTYDADTRQTLGRLGDRIPNAAATEVWEVALAATWHGPPVWFHGDIAHGNLLVRDGRLAAVIDFGCSAVGDPSCDVVIAWTLLSGESRAAFRATLGLDDAAWARGRGWALWKALITLADLIDTDPVQAAVSRRVIDDILDEFERAS